MCVAIRTKEKMNFFICKILKIVSDKVKFDKYY